MIEVAITLGLVLSLLAYEGFGLAAGGLVVPGYIALQLGNPERLAGVFAVALVTAGILRVISRYTFVFGRRQLVLCVLVGCLLSIASRSYLRFDIGLTTLELYAVGWVIPGLIQLVPRARRRPHPVHDRHHLYPGALARDPALRRRPAPGLRR